MNHLDQRLVSFLGGNIDGLDELISQSTSLSQTHAFEYMPHYIMADYNERPERQYSSGD